MTKGSRKLLNWAARTRKIRITASAEGREKLVALGAQLARLTGVVQDIALGQDLGGLVFQEAQGLVQRADGHTADLDRIELLKAVQRTRHGGVADGGDGAERHQLVVGTGDVDVLELVRVQPVDPLDLRDHLVTAAGDVEAVDEITAHHRSDVGTDLLQIEAQVGHLVAVDNDLGLRLIDLDVDDRRKGKHAALHGLELNLLGKLQDLICLGRGGQDELHRKLAAARQRRRQHRKDPNARDGIQLLLNLGQDLEDGALALVPGFDHHAAETGGRAGYLKGEVGFRDAQEGLVDRRSISAGLVEGGVGRCVEDAENNALVLGRRQFLGRHDEHRYREKAYDDPDHVDSRT